MNVGHYTSLSNGDTGEKFVQLFIVSNGQLEVARNDSAFFVVTSRVPRQLENFSDEILQHGGKVHGGPIADSLCVLSLAEKTANASNGEKGSGAA